MHILGKVLVWLTVVLVLAAAWMTSTALGVRHRWLTSVETRQQKIEGQLKDITATRHRVRELEERRQQLVHSWGDVWTAPNSRVQPGGTGAIELGVGASSNLPQKSADGAIPTVFVFGEEGGQSKYLGEFAVTDIRPTQAIAQLTRRPYAQETSEWPQGLYHVRNVLPGHRLTAAAQLQAQQTIADAHIVEQRQQLEVLNGMVQASQAALDQRLAELNGNPDAPANASEDVKDGLVLSVKKSEQTRDSTLTQVDQLRRQVAQTYDEIVKTLQSNLDQSKLLEKRYEQPDSSSAASRATPKSEPLQTSVR
ncbi:MAG TPA: hypothetical protein VNQ76_00985 [Planctomicrobium sp.]|nr:hypothetical protein [Planctomicrobium sp.]